MEAPETLNGTNEIARNIGMEQPIKLLGVEGLNIDNTYIKLMTNIYKHIRETEEISYAEAFTNQALIFVGKRTDTANIIQRLNDTESYLYKLL